MKQNTPSAISPTSVKVLTKALLIFIPIYSAIVVLSTYIYTLQTASDLMLKKEAEVHTLLNAKNNISSELQPIIENLEFITERIERATAEEPKKNAPFTRLIPELAIFSKHHKKYDQLRYIDASGWEKIRINNWGNKTKIVSTQNLQYKGNRYYFKEAMVFKKGMIYVSPFDLNIENGKIETPLKPMIRIAKPVCKTDGTVLGFVILNYLGKYLIKKLEKTSQQDHTELMMLNKDGFWLKGMKKEAEWGFMFKGKSHLNFPNKFPAAWAKINRSRKGQVETINGLFTFSTVSPVTSISASIKPEAIPLITQIHSQRYYWKIVSFMPRTVLYSKHLVWRYWHAVFCLISFFVISWVALKLSWLSTVKKENEHQLVKSKNELEDRVLERTRTLEETNIKLREAFESRKQIKNDLLTSEKKYRTLVETMPEGLLVLDRNGVVTYANNQLLQMLGYHSKDVIGKTYTIFLDKPNLDIFEKRREERISGVTKPYEINLTTGNHRQIQTLVSPATIKDEDGEFNGSFGIISDITQRKNDEKHIQLNRDRLKALLELSKIEGKSEHDLASFALEQGVKLTQSQGGYFHFYDEEQKNIQLTSWSEDVLKICESAKGTHYPLDNAGIWADCIRLGKPVIHNDYQNISSKKGYPDGHFHVTRHMSIPIYDDNRIIAIAGVGNKVMPYDKSDTEQLTLLMTETWRIITKKKIKQDLFASETRYRTLIKTMRQGVVYQNAVGQILSVNQAAENILGVTSSVMLSRTSKTPEWKAIRENGTPIAADNHPSMTAIRTGKQVNNYIMGVFNPQKKHHVWIKVDAVPQFEQDRRTPGSVYTIFEDITETKKAQEAIEASEAKHRSMMEAMDDPAYICSPDYVISYMNPAMINWLGQNFVGKPCYSSIYNLESTCAWCPFEKVKNLEHNKYTLLNPKDQRHYNISNSPIVNADGAISKFTIFRDITETLNLEKQLRHAQKLEAIGTLAGGIAHDFNNILFAILGFAEISLSSVDKDERVYDDIREILKAGHRAKELVQQILTFSRQTEQEMKPIKIQFIVKEALKLLKASLPATIDIRDNISSNSNVLGDPTQIHQVVMNLCTNSAHAMKESGGKLIVELKDTVVDEMLASKFINMPTGRYLHLRISDTGHGIKKNDLERIFEPFFTTKPEGKGTGLGLSLVHGIIKNHNGQISVESTPGQGSCFDIYLPILNSKSDSPGVENNGDALAKGNEKILIVDDEKQITEIIKTNLTRQGYSVDGFTDPVQAFERFSKLPHTYDLVITDMTMPNMTGDLFAEKLLQIRPELPIVLLTGYSKIETDEHLPKGIKGILMKPVIKSDLLDMVRTTLDNDRHFN